MKLYYDRKSHNPTYFIQVGIRNGKKVTTKNIVRIGRHSELLDITDDPLEYAKQKVAEYNEKAKSEKIDMNITVDFSEKLPFCDDAASHSTAKNIGYFIPDRIYSDMGIKKFITDIASGRKIKFDMDTVIRFLVFARILDPRSKLGTYDHISNYYNSPDIKYHQIIRALDILEDNYSEFINALYAGSSKIVKRNTSVCYFDCTNFYFEKEQEDEDVFDDVTGELIKGFLKYGVSKEHRPNPIVQMGLFMDGDGIPLTMCLNPGSDNETLCAKETELKMLRMFEDKDIIYCADAGLGHLEIRKFNSFANRKFIVTQSIKKLSDNLKEAVFNDFDYKLLSDDKSVTLEKMKTFDRFDKENRELYEDRAYKIIPADKLVDVGLYEEKKLKNGKTRKVKSKATLDQVVIVTFSRKMMEYQRKVRNRQIERAKALLEHNADIDEIKKGAHDVKRFLKRSEEIKSTYILDEQVIAEEEKYDGYYAIATNIHDMSVKEILAINSRRYKIEDCFRVMKTNFDARPVYHRKKERITAHFMICYAALLIYRLLEVQLDKKGKHFTTEEILETLRNMNVVNCQDIYYQSIYTGSSVCTALNELYDLGLDKKYYQPKFLNRIYKNLSK